jgi:glycosyltransferase involved in cell wall biosynthesis
MARVIQLVTELVVGGASMSMLEMAEDLSVSHDVHIAHGLLDDPDNPVARRARSSLPTHELPALRRRLSPRNDVAACRSVAALCRRLAPEILHTHSSKAGIVGRLGVPSTIPIVLHTIHGWGHTPLDPAPRRRLMIAAERLAARRTTKLIAVSQDVRDEGIACGIGDSSQYEVIGAPVDLTRSSTAFAIERVDARRRLKIPQDVDVVGWVGRFGEQKDPRTLVEVIAAVLEARSQTTAVLIGDGPQRSFVERHLARYAADERVVMTGIREDVRSLYPAFDVLVHPTRWEGHPRVIQESIASGVPVVTARVNGTREILVHPSLGSAVEVGDTRAFTRELLGILEAQSRRAPIAWPNRELFLTATGDALGQLRSLYDQLLGQPDTDRAAERKRSSA